MKVMKHLRALFLLVVFSQMPLAVTGQMKVYVEYRPRFEYRDGYKELLSEGASPSLIASQRLRMSVSYKSDGIRLKVTLQDIRIWGDEQISSSTGVFGDEGSFDLFEGYAELRLWDKSWVSVGRQQLSYDNQRLLSGRNWNQHGLSYDAVVFKTHRGTWDIHAGTSWNSLSATTSGNTYPSERIKSLNFLWLKKNLGEQLNVSLSHIASGVTETDSTNAMNFRQTSGLYAQFSDGTLSVKGNFYYQYGENQTGNAVSAYLMDVDAALLLGRYTGGAGFSYLSGNDGGDTETDNLFDLLYGARHRFFGHMDYFRNMASHTGGGGLSDWYGFLGYKMSDKVFLKNTTHFFSLAETNQNTPESKSLGMENEVELKYKFNDWGSLKAGWLFYVPTDSFRQMQGVGNERFPNFAFVELTISPNML
ncbi:alginate export family protein [Marinilabilia salmonicolor]|uniref:alginate export family protein n=2 Tax=Marinilabilia salmonicolor TaxID=989 RepID=UPI0012F62D65|nr:alginate export family protein [Marinilabilia salmonicolor]